MSQLFNTGIVVSKGNSTNIPLLANENFIGAIDDTTSYEEIDINLAGAPNNAVGSLYFEFSPDGINWDVSIYVGGYEFDLTNMPTQHLRVVLPYFRVKYCNGNVDQTEFRLTTVYHRVSGARLTRYLNQSINNTEGVEIVRAVMDGYRSDGTYVNLLSNFNNILLVDNSNPQIKTEYDLSNPSVNYIGVAASGSLTDDAVWTIKKIIFDGSGNPTETLWSSNTAVWNDRAVEIYS